MKNLIRSSWVRGAALLLAIVLLGLFVWGGNQPQAAGAVPPPWDKLAHLAWFATLAGLLRLGLPPTMGVRGLLALALACLGIGLWDEWRQLALPGRHFGLDDLLADAVGIALGILLATWAQRVRWKTRVVRGSAVAGRQHMSRRDGIQPDLADATDVDKPES